MILILIRRDVRRWEDIILSIKNIILAEVVKWTVCAHALQMELIILIDIIIDFLL
jgi:hypothetical protein